MISEHGGYIQAIVDCRDSFLEVLKEPPKTVKGLKGGYALVSKTIVLKNIF